MEGAKRLWSGKEWCGGSGRPEGLLRCSGVFSDCNSMWCSGDFTHAY